MYRSTALQVARMLLQRYEQQQKQIQYLETIFRRMERIWNIKIDIENFKIEEAELSETSHSSL